MVFCWIEEEMTFKRWLIALMVLLLVADIAILLDVSVLRQVLGFLCFTTIPGLLILYTLKQNEISFLKKVLLSIGLSISFLIFAGLTINGLLPWFGYSKPLSTFSLVISLTLILAILGFSAYWRNKGSFQFSFPLEPYAHLKDKYLSLLLFPLLFPLLSVIGRHLADTSGNNLVLIVMFLMIPAYIVLLMWQNKKVPEATYPVAILMISLALLLSRGLTSNYLIGGDIYTEYNAFQVVSKNMHWSMAASPNSVTASLSTSLLPAIFQSLLGINPLYVYKVVLLMLTSLIPVIGYVIYERYVGSFYGFLSSFFFIAQIPFIYLLSGHLRVSIALISFSLALMILFDNKIAGLNKRILFLIFLISLVVEYYVLPVIFSGLMVFFWLIPKITKRSPQPLSIIALVILPAMLIFFWWGQLTATAFSSYIVFTKDIIVNLSNLFVEELHGPAVTSLYTLAPYPSPLMHVPSIIQRISFAIISIGVIFTVITKEQRVKFSNYTILMVGSLAILVAEIILPRASIRYGEDRLYIQLLIILAPAFIMGCQAIYNGAHAVCVHFHRRKSRACNSHSKHKQSTFNWMAILIGVMLVCQFFSSSFLYNQLLGFPAHEIMDTKSSRYAELYVHDSEVVAATWLGANNVRTLQVYLGNLLQPDCGGVFEYTDYGANRKFTVDGFRKDEFYTSSYIFLGHLNVVDGRVNSPYLGGLPYGEVYLLTKYAYRFADRKRIYDNGNVNIYR